MNNKVTLQDVADALGISRNTVSKAINNTGSISPATKEKIYRKAAEMGYKQFALATGPSDYTEASVVQSSKEIALFSHSILGGSHFGTKLIDSFQQKLSRFGYKLTMYVIRDLDVEQLTLPVSFNKEHTSGIICLEVFSESYCKFLCSLDIPLLFVDSYVMKLGSAMAADYLFMENRNSSYQMLRSLIEHGCSKLSFVGDRMHCLSFHERWMAFEHAASDYKIPVNPKWCILDDDSSPYKDPKWLAERIRELPVLPDAFFCANDFLAICVIRALRLLGMSVPKDIKVCGFDDSPEATIVDPALTTVKIPSSSMGYLAAELLLSRIEHPDLPFRTTYVNTEVIYRESTEIYELE